MKTIIKVSLVAALAISGVQASSLSAKLNSLEAELADLKKQVKKQNRKINKVKAHDSGDNIKWGVDYRTAYNNINYDMANGSTRGNDSLFSMRLWLNMAYAPDSHNVFKGQLSMNKAFGADFGDSVQSSTSQSRAFSMGGMFDWTANEALTDNNLKVREAYWLYFGDSFFGADIPWTMSVGRRPSTNGFLANLSQDDPANSPLGHIINVEFDGLSSKLDLSNITGITGMSFKVCLGYGSSNAAPLFDRVDGTQYSTVDDALEDITLGGFIFEPYNDGQFIVKTSWYRATSLPGFDSANFMTAFMASDMGAGEFSQSGDMDGGAISVLIDGVTEDGYFADAKIFGSFAYSKTNPDAGEHMLGVTTPLGVFGANPGESQTGTSYWVGAYLPVGEGSEFGTVGVEYNHGSEYWRPFTYAEDTMIGSKIAARGDAFELNYTYQINDALSFQARYVAINYDYAGSNSFFGADGTPMKIDDLKAGDAAFKTRGVNQTDMASLNQAFGIFQNTGDMNAAFQALTPATAQAVQTIMGEQGATQPSPQAFQSAGGQLAQEAMFSGFAGSVVEKAQDLRIYLRYRF